MEDIIIRPLKQDEIPILEDLLYEAVYQPDKENPIPRTILEQPEINVYIKDFGDKKDDYCLVAEVEGRIAGGVWVRILAGEVKGYGNIDSETPEFGISLFEEYRSRGIGTQLMTAMIGYLKSKGCKQTSLSVHKGNYAIGLYLKTGFKIIKEQEEDYLMLLDLKS
ncbi:MAG TPA: GNAT family N-acetyltransferase [Dysgonomonas sp.]|nr:GNAT family N-acetyltransferase [Dysgonomonas sp.]